MTEQEESKWIIETISDGAKSDYWKILKRSIFEWMNEENRRLDSFKRIGIRNEDDVEKYNRAIDRIEYLKKFLTINETIVDYHKSFLDKVKEKSIEFYDEVESFVKEIFKNAR